MTLRTATLRSKARPERYVSLTAPEAGALLHCRAEAMERKRKYVGVVFQCCRVYARIYVNAGGTAYTGCCPRCGKRLVVRIGPAGTDSRFFTAS